MTYSRPIPNHGSRSLLGVLSLCLSVSGACTKTQQVIDDDKKEDGGSHVADGGLADGPAPTLHKDAGTPRDAGTSTNTMGNAHADGGPDAGDDGVNNDNPNSNPAPVVPGLPDSCAKSGRCVVVNNTIDKVDLLFVVDNSNSMKEEQARLGTQLETLISALTSGKAAGGTKFTPADLHLGVVSTDMGLPGVQKVQSCSGLGDDGLLQHDPSTDPALSCAGSYPLFLKADADADSSQVATDLRCIATLGVGGCGFEQQLEAALKAVWPATDPMSANGNNRVLFLTDPATGMGQLGHGDTENKGFLRDATGANASVLAILVVSDEDDGSSGSVEHLIPKQFLDPNDARYNEPLNLRNFYHEDELYPVTRYVYGLRALRPDPDDLLVFGAIVGAPPELVGAAQVEDIATNPMLRQSFYDTLLNDQRMQEVVDPDSLTTPGTGNLTPSCSTLDTDGQPLGKAYPPRRIVQVAREFGAASFVSSICSADFGPAIDQLVDRIGARLGSGCLDDTLPRADDGLVPGCKVLWQLPETGAPDAPATCADGGDFLKPSGGAAKLCEVTQLPVHGAEVGPDSSSMGKNGWYYDDFSDAAGLCLRTQRRLAFTKDAEAPAGVRVILQCQ